jgi:pimeloyl-ACP methyl ester carboxylesterase
MLNWYRASPLRVAEPGRPIADPHILTPEAGRVTCPHLVIWGEGDTALLPETLEGLDAYCTDLTIRRVPGADHWICHQKPDAVAALIDDFLTRA